MSLVANIYEADCTPVKSRKSASSHISSPQLSPRPSLGFPRYLAFCPLFHSHLSHQRALEVLLKCARPGLSRMSSCFYRLSGVLESARHVIDRSCLYWVALWWYSHSHRQHRHPKVHANHDFHLRLHRGRAVWGEQYRRSLAPD